MFKYSIHFFWSFSQPLLNFLPLPLLANPSKKFEGHPKTRGLACSVGAYNGLTLFLQNLHLVRIPEPFSINNELLLFVMQKSSRKKCGLKPRPHSLHSFGHSTAMPSRGIPQGCCAPFGSHLLLNTHYPALWRRNLKNHYRP